MRRSRVRSPSAPPPPLPWPCLAAHVCRATVVEPISPRKSCQIWVRQNLRTGCRSTASESPCRVDRESKNSVRIVTRHIEKLSVWIDADRQGAAREFPGCGRRDRMGCNPGGSEARLHAEPARSSGSGPSGSAMERSPPSSNAAGRLSWSRSPVLTANRAMVRRGTASSLKRSFCSSQPSR